MDEQVTMIDFSHPPISSDPEELFSILKSQASSYLQGAEELDLLFRAYVRAAELHDGARRDSGEPYITHPLHVALILAHLGLDVETLAAALLHDVLEDTDTSYDELAEEFGPQIADLVEGVTKLSKVSTTSPGAPDAANIQKIYLAMSKDLRVIFIKLADRLHNLRTLAARQDSASRQRTATEALEVYARIADRLGVAILRKEIEDTAFSYLNPTAYRRLKESIEQRYAENADQIQEIRTQVLSLLADQEIRVVADGIRPNPRRVYDMYRRLQEALDPLPGKTKRVLPLLRFHLIVEDTSSCYLAMAAIHARWPTITSETRDYISTPLANGYQSLHTTVFINQQPIKFQIRTMWMHTTSQLGIVAYMQKGSWSRVSPELNKTVDDLRRFGVETLNDLSDPDDFLTLLKAEMLGDDIYVYTPKNKVIDLPIGSTPIDFAYRIHTDVGHQCRGALVDGHWVPLTRPLRTGERIEILTVEDSGPSFDWLNPSLGYTISPLAKTKIRRWFRRRSEAERLELGRRELFRVINRLALEVTDLAALAKRFNYSSEQQLFLEIGGCDLPLERVIPDLLDVYGPKHLSPLCKNTGAEIPVSGTGSLSKSLASCCQPQEGDDIVGYIVGSDHVQVHRSDCAVFLSRITEDKSRFVEVWWGHACETYAACLEIYARDRPFFLRDVWNVISDQGLNVAHVKVRVNRARDARITVCVDIENWLQFNDVLTRLEDLPGAISVQRKTLPTETLDLFDGEEEM